MRIISGKLGGLAITVPKNSLTHPMSDKIKNALFNSLGDLSGKTVLDGFAGTGALGLEACSRGASQVVLIEKDKRATVAIKQTIVLFGVEKSCKAIQANLFGWSDNNPAALFDIVLADPAYDKPQLPLLQKLVSHLQPSGVFVLSWPGKKLAPDFLGLEIYKAKKYGDAQLVFYCFASKAVSQASATD